MRIVDEKLLAEFREKSRACEWCGRENRTGLDPHHVRSRGAGGSDVRLNLVALCRQCHDKVHCGRIHPRTLIDIVAKRERVHRDSVMPELDRILRLPKGATP